MDKESIQTDIRVLKEYIAILPKTELHAHLSGSIREETIIELIHKHYQPGEIEQQIQVCKLKANDPNDKRDLNECFALFKVLHRIVSSRDILYRIAMEVLEDFVFDDRVMYIELRTTPRAIPSQEGGTGCSKAGYVSTICDAIAEFKLVVSLINSLAVDAGADLSHAYINSMIAGMSAPAQTLVKRRVFGLAYAYAFTPISAAPWFVDAALLLSFDRSSSVEDAQDTLSVAADARAIGMPVIGLDFSGNPYLKSFIDFRNVFHEARVRYGFKISIHFAETPNETDSHAILDFAPDRVGHAAVLTPELYNKLIDSRVPVEVCLTSNASCKLHPEIDTHPLLPLYAFGHPISLCTDDKGVFGRSLTHEWEQLLTLAPFNPHAEICLHQRELSGPFASPASSVEHALQALYSLACEAPMQCFATPAVIHHMREVLRQAKP